jgi:hypothetical protein
VNFFDLSKEGNWILRRIESRYFLNFVRNLEMLL